MKAKDLTDVHVDLQLFAGYTDLDTAILEEFRSPEAKPRPGFLTDFLGCRIRTSSVWKEARKLDGQLLGMPMPADFHSEAIEWLGLLRAVKSARDKYVAMELGAGFGPWSVAGAVAARRRGVREIRLCAIEADPQHYLMLRQHFADNGIEPSQHRLIEAAVGVHAGVAQWPVIEQSAGSEEWGLRPLESDQLYNGRRFARATAVQVIPMLDLVKEESRWDLVHIDVQGSEVEICRSCIDELTSRVCWLIVGTHSRKLDGDLLELMCRAGWVLEFEKPTKFAFVRDPRTLEAMTTNDGTQVWRNPHLTVLQAGDQITSFSQQISCAIDRISTKPGETSTLDIQVKNTGTDPWYSGARVRSVNAGYRWRDVHGNLLPLEGNRAPMRDRAIQPGESVSLKLDVTAPVDPGSYTLWVSMVQEQVNWFFERNATPLVLPVTVSR